MPEISANFIVQPYNIDVTLDSTDINVTVEPVNLNIYSGGYSQPEGNAGQLQYNVDGQVFGGAANTDCSNGNVRFTNISNLKIDGGNSGYFLQTDGAGTLTWVTGTANITGNGTPAGANNQIQLSDGAGNFKVGPGFSFDPSSNILSAPGNINITSNVNANNGNFTTNVTAQNFIGNFVGNISFAANANYSNFVGTVLTNAQPNITSLGNLTDLRLTATEIHLGLESGQVTQGGGAIAIGRIAGKTNQGQSSIAIGEEAAQTNLGQYSIAIGAYTGVTSANAVVIGYLSGGGANSVSVGRNAQSSTDSVAIGSNAKATQPNTIVLNATGANLANAPSGANTFVVKPVRSNITSNGLYYDTTTGEVTYGSVTTSSISNGTSNVSIPAANGNITLSVAGTSNVIVVSSTGATVGNLDVTTGNITTINTGNMRNGNSRINITANSNVTLTVQDGERLRVYNQGANITGVCEVSGNTTSNNFIASSYVRITPRTVANLAAASIGAGTQSFVTDSNVAAAGNFGNQVYGGGSNNVPVYSDGTIWRIG